MTELELLLAVALVIENAVIMLIGVVGQRPACRDPFGESPTELMRRSP